jgi:cytochrome c5
VITTLNRSILAALVLLLAATTWNLFAEPKANQKAAAAKSNSAVSNDSYMGLSGEELWSNNCLRCHNIRPPTMYSNAQWDVIVHHMRLRANITGQEQRAIVEFLKSAK